MFYLLSLKHTSPKDLVFTFWRANGHGYSFLKTCAGLYGEREANIHIATGKGGGKPTTIKVDERVADEMFVSCLYEGRASEAIPVNENTLARVGVKLEDLQGNPFNWAGFEFIVDVDSKLPSEVITKHKLEFLVADDSHDTGLGFQLFKVGTCEGHALVKTEVGYSDTTAPEDILHTLKKQLNNVKALFNG